ncbi:MAG: 50S ribosomal protein L23 [Puniceicoccaceae bacterium]
MIDPSTILLNSRVTEKTSDLTANLNQYTFEVFPDANRTQVKLAIEQVFKVSVTKVNILNIKPKLKTNRTRRGRPGRISGIKKAIVTLNEGDAIELI